MPGAATAFEVVQTLVEGLGLPEWFLAFALILLIVGMPVVLATASVQEGVPARGSARSLEELDRIIPDQEQGGPGAPRRLLTWKNALGEAWRSGAWSPPYRCSTESRPAGRRRPKIASLKVISRWPASPDPRPPPAARPVTLAAPPSGIPRHYAIRPRPGLSALPSSD